MIYVNTLMLQQVLAQLHWSQKLESPRPERAVAADLGASEPVRPLRAGYERPDTARLTQMAAGDKTAGSTPTRSSAAAVIVPIARTSMAIAVRAGRCMIISGGWDQGRWPGTGRSSCSRSGKDDGEVG